MIDEPIDLTVFDPPVEALARDVHERCAVLLAERRRSGTLVQIADWWRPVIAAVAVISLASTLFLVTSPRIAPRRGRFAVDRPAPFARAPLVELAQALGVPGEIARSLTMRPVPSVSRLVDEVGR
ncbi:MAG TPA: hypothetical protein VGH98_10640 [Gemmatimonadaceae bacterium]|jgi:hypothetical protein